jgi:hypothetical protein
MPKAQRHHQAVYRQILTALQVFRYTPFVTVSFVTALAGSNMTCAAPLPEPGPPVYRPLRTTYTWHLPRQQSTSRVGLMAPVAGPLGSISEDGGDI